MEIAEAVFYVALYFWVAGITTEHIAKKLVAEREWIRNGVAIVLGVFWPVFIILRLVHDINKVGSKP